MILKVVFGKLPDRNDLVKLLNKTFKVSQRNLTALTYLDVMEVMSMKLVDMNYIKGKAGATPAHLKKDDLIVIKQVDAWL